MTFILPTLAVGFAAFCVWLSRWLSSRWAPRAKRPIVPIVALLLISAACMRWELFAPESAPPASAWRDDHHLFDNAEPLQNLPVVVSTAIRKWGLSVTVANRGAATLIYWAVGSSRIHTQHWARHRSTRPDSLQPGLAGGSRSLRPINRP